MTQKRVRTFMKQRRMELGLSQEAAARRAGISTSMWVQVESGTRTPSLEVARRIASVLRSTIDQLFGVA